MTWLVLFLAVTLAAPALCQESLGPMVIGYHPQSITSNTTFTQDSSAEWVAYSFVLDSARTLNKVKFRVNVVTGTLDADDITMDLYSDSNGTVGTLIESRNTVTSIPTGISWVEVTGFTTSLAAWTRYWLIVKNTAAVPASNYWTQGLARFAYQSGMMPVSGTWGWSYATTVDSGANWTYTGQGPYLRLEFSSPTAYAGWPANISGSVTAAGEAIYDDRELGVKFTAPSNVAPCVRGLAMYISRSNSPPGNLRFRLYSDTTLVATTGAVPASAVSTTVAWFYAYFSSCQALTPGAAYRVVAGTTNGGNAANYYRSVFNEFENDVNSLALKPMAGTLAKTYYDGSSWTDTAIDFLPFALILDTAAPFTSAGSGNGGAIPAVISH